ncbi:MAG: 4Fe-4S dicluster domain-containing protein [Myxococcota bacterium]
MDEKYAKWKGVPREKISWAPIINVDKCTGCGMCITSCGRDVFDFDIINMKAIVARPLQCMVGCTSCKVWCVFNAIYFPDENIVRDFIVKNKILVLAKKQLKQKYPDIDK